MDLPELLAIQPRQQLTDWRADEGLLVPGLDPRVLLIRAKEQDVLDVDQPGGRAHRALDPAQRRLLPRRAGLSHALADAQQLVEHRVQRSLVPGRSAPGLAPGFQADLEPVGGLRQPLRLDWLEQVIKRALLERRDGVFVVGRDEDDLTRPGRQRDDLGGSLQPRHARHPDVQEDHIGTQRLGSFQGFLAIPGFAADLEFGPDFGQPALELFAQQPFVVGQHSPQFALG